MSVRQESILMCLSFLEIGKPLLQKPSISQCLHPKSLFWTKFMSLHLLSLFMTHNCLNWTNTIYPSLGLSLELLTWILEYSG